MTAHLVPEKAGMEFDRHRKHNVLPLTKAGHVVTAERVHRVLSLSDEVTARGAWPPADQLGHALILAAPADGRRHPSASCSGHANTVRQLRSGGPGR
jgi:hypothetical protein